MTWVTLLFLQSRIIISHRGNCDAVALKKPQNFICTMQIKKWYLTLNRFSCLFVCFCKKANACCIKDVGESILHLSLSKHVECQTQHNFS